MDREQFIPNDGPPDIRGMLRFARAQIAAARRQRDARKIRQWRRLVVKCLRVLRFEAKMKAGRARPRSHCWRPLFSDAPEKVLETLSPTDTPISDHRRAFREGRRRR